MWFNNNSPTTTTAVLLLFVIGAVVAQSRTPGKRPSSSREAAKRPPPQSSSAESSGGAGGDLTDECPEPNGYFADAYQCDKYYECRDGAITEKLCPDGMVFNDYSINHEKCDLPFNIDCSQRSELQKPKPALHCPRQNGYFSHEEANVCDKFYYCVDGKYNQIVCPDGLVYNEKTGICTWPDEAKKKGCSSQGVLRAKRSTPPPFYSLGGGVIQRRYLVKEKPKDRPRIQARVTSGYGIQAQNTAVKPRYNGMFDNSDYDDHDFYDDDYDFKSDENYEDISISELINGGEKKKDRDEDEDEDDEDEDKGGEEEGEDDRRSRERGSRERGSRESKESKEKGSKSSEEEDSDERGDVDYDYYVYHDYEEGDKRGRSNARNRAGDRSMTSVEEAERRRWEAPRTDAKRLTTFNNDRRTKPIGVHEISTKNKLNVNPDDYCWFLEVFKFTCPAVGMSEAQQHPRYADPEDCQYFYVCINGETPRRNGCKRGQVFNDATKNCDWPRNVPECGDWYKGILTDAELEELEHPKPKQRPDSQAATANRRKQSNKYRPHQSSREAPVDDIE